MSLLLKALQNAARNREAAGNPGTRPDAGERKEPPTELSLEPVQPSPRASARSHSALDEDRVERQPPAGPQHAQTVLRAGSRPEPIRRREPGFVDWLGQRPLVAFSTAAGLFAIGYGIYLYLQITNPALFIAQPSPPPRAVAAAPQPPLSPPRPPASATPPGPSATAVAPRAPSTASSSRLDAPGAGGAQSAAPQPESSAPGRTGAASAPAVPGGPAAPASASASPPPASSASVASSQTPGGASAPGASSRTRSVEAERSTSGQGAPGARRSPDAVASSGSISDAPAAERSPGAGGARVVRAPETSIGTPAAAPTGTPSRSRSGSPRQAAAPQPADGVSEGRSAQVVAVNSDIAEGYAALERGQLDEAERLYRGALASDGRNVDALLGLASVLGQRAQGDAASRLYMRVLELDPRNTYAQAGLLNLTGQADPYAAEARLKQLIAREPSAFLYFTLGNLYSEQRQWAAAQGAYFQAHKLAPDNPDYAFNLAVGLEHLSQPKIALDYYKRAVSLAQARGHAQFEVPRVENRIRSLEAALTQ